MKMLLVVKGLHVSVQVILIYYSWLRTLRAGGLTNAVRKGGRQPSLYTAKDENKFLGAWTEIRLSDRREDPYSLERGTETDSQSL